MTAVVDARRVRVLPGDRALVAAAAVGLVGLQAEALALPDDFYWKNADTELTYLVVLLLLLAGGIVSIRRAEQRGNGRLMLLAVLASVIRGVAGDRAEIGPLAFVADLVQWSDSILLGHLLLRWPDRQLHTRAERAAVIVAWTVPLALFVAGDLLYDPRRYHWTVPTWWPLLLDAGPVAFVLFDVASWIWAGLLVVFAVLVLLRVRRSTRLERRELVPVVIAIALAVVANAMGTGEALRLWGDLHEEVFSNLSGAAIPVALLISLAVRRVQRALAVEELVERGRTAQGDEVVRALRRALGDRRMEVATFSAEAGGYVTTEGGPAPPVTADRRALFLPAADGSPLARLTVDPRLEQRPDLTEPIARAASVALETIRLRAELASRAEAEAAVRAQLDAATEESAALSRLLPSGLPEKLRADPGALGRIDEVEVTVLMSDVRGYSTIAERTAPDRLARQLQQHREAMNAAVLAEGGTIMQYVGDAVMAVFGAPFELPDHAARAVRAAAAMHLAQAAVNERWAVAGFEPFGLGIGVSTGPVATAVLGSADRYEYTIVGDTVNLAQRLESQARPAGTTIASEATIEQVTSVEGFEPMPPMTVKGRVGSTNAFRRTDTAEPVAARSDLQAATG